MYAKYFYQKDLKSHIKFIKDFDANKINDYIQEHVLLKNTIVSITDIRYYFSG